MGLRRLRSRGFCVAPLGAGFGGAYSPGFHVFLWFDPTPGCTRPKGLVCPGL